MLKTIMRYFSGQEANRSLCKIVYALFFIMLRRLLALTGLEGVSLV